jgi:hypothetical protein
VAPTVRANSRFHATGSTAITWLAPRNRAPWTALMPTPPTPITIVVSPGFTWPRYSADPQPVGMPQLSRAATSNGNHCGSGMQDASVTTMWSEKEPSRQKPPSGCPSRRAR